jgi:hypothetical protein
MRLNIKVMIIVRGTTLPLTAFCHVNATHTTPTDVGEINK